MAPDEIHVWSLAFGTIPHQKWAALEAVLDGEERARAARSHFERNRRAYVAAHALVRHMLAHFAGCEAGAWRFAAKEHGKPYIADPLPSLPLRFNLTHTDHMAAVAVTLAGDVGIDAKSLDRITPDFVIADDCFAAEEVAALHALTGDAIGEHFIRLWTLKEAFIKAIGKGLSQPLSDFAFVSVDPVRVVFHDRGLGDAALWVFRQWQVGRHMLALAIDWPYSCPPRVIHRSVCCEPLSHRAETVVIRRQEEWAP